MSEYKNILVTQAFNDNKHISLVTLNRPKVLNALSTDLMHELVCALEKLDKDSNVRAIILTGNQNVVISGLSTDDKGKVDKLLKTSGLINDGKSGLRLNSIACVALNVCPMAFSEAERYLPSLIDNIDEILKENKLEKDEISIRMTGCPNGCGRPYLGEIGFVGRAPGRYNMYLGAGFSGDRLNFLYKEMLNEEQILAELGKIIPDYAKNREKNERFGDFALRKEYVKEIKKFMHYQI